MNYRYETVIVFDSALDENSLKTQVEKFEGVVKNHSGVLEHQHMWGRRNLAFPINKKTSGSYVYLIFSGDNTVVSDLNRQLKINESVLRHMIVKKDKYGPDLSKKNKPEELDLSLQAILGSELDDEIPLEEMI